MAHDDWRIRVELPHKGEAHGFFDRLTQPAPAWELERELRNARLPVSRDDDTVFIYADTARQAELARSVLERELAEADIRPLYMTVEHWIGDENRWDDEEPSPGYEEEVLERGFAPWEVRVELPSHDEAEELANRLEAEGYEPVRRWKYLVVGVRTREEADELAKRLHGDVEPGGEVVWEAYPTNPFAAF
jgi:hypothetical protein